jgi:hypothetical protein
MQCCNFLGLGDLAQEQASIKAFDAPEGPGPWALKADGSWFKVPAKLFAPGGRAVNTGGRHIYIPPEHPSVRVKEGQYNAGTKHLQRFNDPKFRAANAAMLRPNPFENLFFNVAPRGGLLSAGREFQSEDANYSSEGGYLYPGLEHTDPVATRLNQWYLQNSFDNRWGYPRGLTLNWLRMYTDPANGYRKYRPFTQQDFKRFGERWWLADHGFICPPDEIVSLTNLATSKQRERQAAQTEGRYSVHYPWAIGPMSQCSKSSRSRRYDLLRKVAVVAGVVVGAVFLGPAIVGGLKTGGAAVMAKGGAVVAKVGGVIGGTTGAISAGAAAIIPKVIDGVNAARTVKAIKDGEVPPPPISLQGDNFTDWAFAIAQNELEAKTQEKISEQEAMILREERQDQQRIVEREQRLTQQPIQQYPYPQVSPEVQVVMQGEQKTDDTMKFALMAGIPVLAMLLMKG